MNEIMKRKIYRTIIVGGAFLCFVYIAYSIYNNEELGFDTTIREWLYSIRTPLLNRAFIIITYCGNWQTITLLGAVLLINKRTRKTMGLPFAITGICSTIIYKFLKQVFMRPRPELLVRIIKQGGYSFPSGHAMNGLVCYGILIYLINRYVNNQFIRRGLSAFLTISIFIIGSSRIYVGVHYPTDIIGGWAIGTVVLTIAINIIEKMRGIQNDN